MKKFFAILTAISMIFMSSCSSNKNKSNYTSDDFDTVKIGILFSSTGESAIVEQSMKNAAILAFDEINEDGGINGKQVECIFKNYSSDPTVAQEKIKELIEDDNVVATVGCYSSSSRKATFPILEQNNSLLVYPAYTEGEEVHPNVVYTGAMTNQQSSDYLKWLIENCGKKAFLLGNDYVFPVACNKQAKMIIAQNDGLVCGEEYAPLGYSDFSDIFKKIDASDADFIYCNLIGDSLVLFFQEYAKHYSNSKKIPIASITFDEMTLKSVGSENAEGNYASMSYFSSIDSAENKAFVEKYNSTYNDGSVVTVLAESTYSGCYLLAKALSKVDNFYDTDSVINAFSNLEFNAPQGTIHIDESNHCTWVYSRFAQIHNGEFEIIYESSKAVAPEPWAYNSTN